MCKECVHVLLVYACVRSVCVYKECVHVYLVYACVRSVCVCKDV